MKPTDLQVTTTTQQWIQSFVIAHNLCPFAKKPLEEDRIRFVVCNSPKTEKVLQQFWQEIEILDNSSMIEISNSFIILPKATPDFQQFIGLVQMAEQLLVEQNKKDIYQLVAFHPSFKFEGTEVQDAGNQVNQSPYPMIHMLREEEVAEAIEAYGDTSQISLRNQKLMEERGENLS